MYFSLILMANKFYSILFISINDQRLKEREEKKTFDAAEEKDEEKKNMLRQIWQLIMNVTNHWKIVIKNLW